MPFTQLQTRVLIHDVWLHETSSYVSPMIQTTPGAGDLTSQGERSVGPTRRSLHHQWEELRHGVGRGGVGDGVL